ncbi:hypothetical protein H4R18_001994 [Coemansia javaensis]|uniref:FYR N-terminal domain-containing protein n=1 Tax=Coemansia javaensis TaxID=2761396 RepID=A0A9W8HI02_9FUNG|nr:hypothetical protein H4R18_001994 [Coemansia javaensis]
MSYREMANDLTTRVKQALERRDDLLKMYQASRDKLRTSRAENEHLLDMILKAYPEMGDDASSCSSSDEGLSDSPGANGHGANGHGGVPALRNGKRGAADSPAQSALNSPAHMTKRRRRPGKRDDRSDPKHVEPLQRDAEGRIVFPITVGRGQDQIEIHSLGRVVWASESYHTSRYIWTPGFRSTRLCPSIKTGDPGCVYTSEILEGPDDAPVFQVTAEDMPDQPFRAGSSSGAWKQILDTLTAKGVNVKTHASGPQMYGLSHLGVTKAIQELENAEKCNKYIRQQWIEAPADGAKPSGTDTPATTAAAAADDDGGDDDDGGGGDDDPASAGE